MSETRNSRIKFIGYNPHIAQLRTDKGWRVSFDVSQDQYDIIKELPNLQEEELTIQVNGSA